MKVIGTSELMDSPVNPDFIYNRFDLFENDYLILCFCSRNKQQSIEVAFRGNEAEVGLWLVSISEKEITEICKYIFKEFRNVKKIIMRNCLIKMGNATSRKHYLVDLQKSNGIDKLLSSKSRYNIRREYSKIEKNIGRITFSDYSVEKSSIEVINKLTRTYFQQKQLTHGKEYGLTVNEYLTKYHVSNIYCLMTGDIILSILMSCEQCSNVYVENMSYDENYKAYSPGKILYDCYLRCVYDKGYNAVFLGNGEYEYKRRYNSLEQNTFDCVIYRNKFVEKLKSLIKAIRLYL